MSDKFAYQAEHQDPAVFPDNKFVGSSEEVFWPPLSEGQQDVLHLGFNESGILIEIN
jgi:hypothetical protein